MTGWLRRNAARVGDRLARWGRPSPGPVAIAVAADPPATDACRSGGEEGGISRRLMPAALAGAAAAIVLGRSGEAAACCGTVYDPAVDMSVMAAGSTLGSILDVAGQLKGLQSEMLGGVGKGLGLGDLAPEVSSALDSLRKTLGSLATGGVPQVPQLGSISLGSLGAGLPISFQRNLPAAGTGASGTNELFSSTVADATKIARTSFEPSTGAELSTLERLRRRRVAEARNATFDGLGVAYHGLQASRGAGSRLSGLGDVVGSGDATMRQQMASHTTVLLSVLEEIQTTNRLVAAMLRLQASSALRGEDLGSGYDALEDA